MREFYLLSMVLFSLVSFGQVTITHTIAEIQGEQFSSPLVGQYVTTTGIVSANNVMSTSGVSGYFVQDGSGPWNGVYVYDTTHAPNIGDEIIMEAEVAEYFDVTELTNVVYFEVVSSGNDVPAPSVVSTGELASSEAYEGCFVQIINAICTNPDTDFGEALFDDGSGEVKTNDYMYLPAGGWIQGETYSIAGCMHYSFEEYKLEVRSEADVVVCLTCDQSVSDCTDPVACNYNSDAVEDDGSCEYDSCAGCMDEAACNFDPTATIENDTDCTFPGCSDPESSNYDSSAGCSGECIYLTYDCASIGEEAWSNEEIGLFPNWQQAMHGVGWEGEWVFNVPATVLEPQSSVSYGVHHVAWSEVDGLPDWVNSSEFTLGDLEASSQHCIAASGIPSAPGIHEITASGEVFISIFGQEFSIGEQTYSAWLEVTENPNPIPGCMYATAVNYEAYATVDNGSCLFAGCTDENAGNFNPLATIDDGSCGEACDPENESMCTTDVNNDGFVNVSDLLLLLSEFGETCQ